MPDTIIACVNDLSCNEPNQFILIECSCCPIGDIEIPGMDRDNSNKNKSPHDPPHKMQATEEAW